MPPSRPTLMVTDSQMLATIRATTYSSMHPTMIPPVVSRKFFQSSSQSSSTRQASTPPSTRQAARRPMKLPPPLHTPSHSSASRYVDLEGPWKPEPTTSCNFNSRVAVNILFGKAAQKKVTYNQTLRSSHEFNNPHLLQQTAKDLSLDQYAAQYVGATLFSNDNGSTKSLLEEGQDLKVVTNIEKQKAKSDWCSKAIRRQARRSKKNSVISTTTDRETLNGVQRARNTAKQMQQRLLAKRKAAALSTFVPKTSPPSDSASAKSQPAKRRRKTRWQ